LNLESVFNGDRYISLTYIIATTTIEESQVMSVAEVLPSDTELFQQFSCA